VEVPVEVIKEVEKIVEVPVEVVKEIIVTHQEPANVNYGESTTTTTTNDGIVRLSYVKQT